MMHLPGARLCRAPEDGPQKMTNFLVDKELYMW